MCWSCNARRPAYRLEVMGLRLTSAAVLALGVITSACTANPHPTPTITESNNSSAAPDTASAGQTELPGASDPGPVERFSLGDASILKPVSWIATPYRGMPATVISPLVFLSATPFTEECAGRNADSSRCTTADWFPPDAHTPADGALILWLAATFPTNVAWTALPGRNTRINGHRARVYSGAPINSCPDGTATEVEANILIATKPLGAAHLYPGSRLAMTACLGPNISATDRAAVTTMLHSLHIRTRAWF